jgi:hypothetical protein
MGAAQSRHCGKPVENIAHGAQAHHKQAKAGLRLQSSIFAQALAPAFRQARSNAANRDARRDAEMMDEIESPMNKFECRAQSIRAIARKLRSIFGGKCAEVRPITSARRTGFMRFSAQILSSLKKLSLLHQAW